MDAIGLFLFVSGYLVWISLFVVLAWRGRTKVLAILGAAMLLAFAACYALVVKPAAPPTDPASIAVLLSLAYAVLPAPLVVAAIVYPIGRCRAWYRISPSGAGG